MAQVPVAKAQTLGERRSRAEGGAPRHKGVLCEAFDGMPGCQRRAAGPPAAVLGARHPLSSASARYGAPHASRAWLRAPFGAGGRAVSQAYRQPRDIVAEDLRALLGAGGRADSLGKAFSAAEAAASPPGAAVLGALEAVWGAELAKIAALDLLAVLGRLAVALVVGWLLQGLEGQPGAELESRAGRIGLLVAASVVASLAQHGAAHRRVRTAAVATARLQAAVFRRRAQGGAHLGELRSELSRLPDLAYSWVEGSRRGASAYLAGACLAIWPLVGAMGVVGLAAVPIAVVAQLLEARLRCCYATALCARVSESKARREAASLELIGAMSLVKTFAWERPFFSRYGALRSDEKKAMHRLARGNALAVAAKYDLLVPLQVAACVVLWALLHDFSLQGSGLHVWQVLQIWIACHIGYQQLQRLRRVLLVQGSRNLAAAVEAAAFATASVALTLPSLQGSATACKSAKHAVTIEGMRFFWVASKASKNDGLPVVDRVKSTEGAPSESLWGPSAKVSGIVSASGVAHPGVDLPTAASPLLTSAEQGLAQRLVAAPPVHGGPKPGWDLVDEVTDDGSVAERFARVARGRAEFDLKVLSLHVRRGSLAVFVGASGSGKSTLLAGVLGACGQEMWGDDAEGTGVVVSGRLAYVPQTPALLRDTSVRDNVLCGLPFDGARYERALSMSTLAEDLSGLAGGDASDVGDLPRNGADMALQLARAIFSDSEVLLIDDPFVDMEPQRAARVLSKGLRKLGKEKTVLLVTQNLSLLAGLPLIIVMRNGTIFEQGDHRTLSSMPSEFSRLLLVSRKKEAARARARRGPSCPFLAYDVEGDPMSEAFPLDRELWRLTDGSAEPPSARSSEAGRGEALGKDRGLRERRRGGFLEAPDLQDLADLAEDRPLAGPPGAGQRPKARPACRAPPAVELEDHEPLWLGAKHGQLAGKGDPQPSGELAAEKDFRDEKPPASPEPLQRAAASGESTCFAAPLFLRSGGLASMLLVLLVLLSVGGHLAVRYSLALVLAPVLDPEPSTTSRLDPVLTSRAPSPSPGPSPGTQTDPGLADSGVGTVGSDGVLWRGFDELTTTPAPLATTALRSTTGQFRAVQSATWVRNETGMFCSETIRADEAPPGDFECDHHGCRWGTTMSLRSCEQTCVSFAQWGCRHISWGGPDSPERWCYILRRCSKAFPLPRYATSKLVVIFADPSRRIASSQSRRLSEGVSALTTSAYLPAALAVVGLLSSALAVGQVLLSASVGLLVGQSASLKQLRSLLAAPPSLLSDSVQLRSRLIDDVADVDAHLSLHIPPMLAASVHILTTVAAISIAGGRLAILVVVLALTLGVALYLHARRLPLVRQLRRLQREAQNCLARRVAHLADCRYVFRAHGSLLAACEEFEAQCRDVSCALIAGDLAERWLCTRLHILVAALQGLTAFCLLEGAELPSRVGIATLAVALFEATLLGDALASALRHAVPVHLGLAALQRMRCFRRTLPTEELESPALLARPTAKALRECEGRAARRHGRVLGDRVVEGDPLSELSRLEPQGVSEAGFPLENVAEDWPNLGAVELEAVTLQTALSSAAPLREVSLRLPAAGSLLVLGPSKSGKSSLIRAILRLCPVAEGRIVIDSVDVRCVGLSTLRSRIAVVPEETTIFGGTWRSNLDPIGEFDDRQIRLATRITRLSSWLARAAPRGLEDEPQSGEVGPEIRMLVGVSRAVLRLLQRRSKLLLLDCATCRLDVSSDAALTALLLQYCRRREAAMLQTSGRAHQVALYDSTCVLQNGRVVEHGPAKQLWAKDGPLRSFARAQGVDSSLLSKAEPVYDRLTSASTWDISPQEDPAWSDDFAVSIRKVKPRKTE